MNKMKVLGIALFAVFSFLIAGCEEPPVKSPPPKPMNIIILLDTSDRVSEKKNREHKRLDQAQKDIVIAKGIVNFYHDQARRKLFNSRNRLTFAVPNQPMVVQVPQEITKKLKIWPTNEDRRIGPDRFEEMRKELLEGINELYKFVNRRNQFTGSDIWSWFRDSAKVSLKSDALNYIICLSDGYLDFNNDIQKHRPKIGNKTSYIPYSQVKKFRNNLNWKQKFHTEGHGLLEIGEDFSSYSVKFLMVEITHRHMLDLEIVKEYWQTWLKSMGIADSQFLPMQDDPQFVTERIKEFISTK